MRIIFMGTPDFAVPGLSALLEAGHDVCAVITSPDKPAGRGRQIQSPPIKSFTLEHNEATGSEIPVLQPENLKDQGFLSELKELEPELIVVVAFRMLPEAVWSLPPKGTINLHASLLPHYRGAAPINRVIMNGETETGLTTFYIEKDIDTGKIILQEKLNIGPEETAGELHDRMMDAGAALLVKTLNAIENAEAPAIAQSSLLDKDETVKKAPKIHPEDCRIEWNKSLDEVYNHVRGLSPYPAAWTTLVSPDGKHRKLKVFTVEKKERDSVFPSGTLLSDGKCRMEVVCRSGILNILELQLEGKKRMETAEFCRGIKDLPSYNIE